MVDIVFADPAVAARFAAMAEPARTGLLDLRRLILATAATTPGVGPLLETLKWGQPAYLTPITKSGSTLRLDATNGGFAIYAHCQTTIIADFQSLFPHDFTIEGARAVHFRDGADLPHDKLRFLISRALTYYLKTAS